MKPEDAQRDRKAQEVFGRALEMHNREARAGFVAGACGDDASLRVRVEALLASDVADDFLEAPPAGLDFQRTVRVNIPITEKPGDTIGRYKLLQQIGEGGCGVVYMAEQEEPVRRRVALKVIKLGMDTKSVIARFEAERQALALMDHPNIAKVLDVGATDAGRPYFVMELVRGLKITDYCDQANLATRERLDLFIKVCQAIQHAHQKGIIHRDIKPSNILVTLHDGVPVPKVIDFGIAKATTDQRLTDKTLFTALEQFIGTPAYMSPEQAEMSGLDIDTRCDIYSLGVLLYELLTGKTPFDAKELVASGIDAMRKTIREQEPLRPSTRLNQELLRTHEGKGEKEKRGSEAASRSEPPSPLLPSAPFPPRQAAHPPQDSQTSAHRLHQLKQLIPALRGDVDWIVMKCLEKDRARRYDTANGLAMDIQRHLNNEAVLARPASVAYRFQKLVRRNKLAVAAATAVAAALVIGLGAATVMFFRERLARKGEQEQRIEAQSAQKVAENEQQRADAQARKASESQQQSRRLLYASDMNLAQQSLQLNNLGKARRLLDRHRPQPSEEDLRGWEWRYLWQLTRSSALVTLTNRPVRGSSVSFSPDGSRLAVGWNRGRVDLWDVPGQRLIRALTDREYSYPYQGKAAFSPVRNLLAATSEPGVIAMYDLDSGRESILWRAPDPGAWDVRELAFSQDGSRVVIFAGSAEGLSDEVWVVNVSSAKIESHHPTFDSSTVLQGAARLSPDNRRLYLPRPDALNHGHSIRCLDLATGQELWQTQGEREGLATLAVSPDGRVLASSTAFQDSTIRVWDSATGGPVTKLDGHTCWVSRLAFTRDGRHLISAASDQTIRFWDTGNWTETRVLRGHTDEVHAVAISDHAHLIASVSKDGDLMLWKEDRKSVTEGYSRLPENLGDDHVAPLDHSRVLLLPPGKPPGLVDLKRDSLPGSLPEIGSSTNVLGSFGTNILCLWNGTNQILVRELRGAEFIQRGAIALDSGTRPIGFAYNATRQLLAWSEGTNSGSIYVASLAAPGRRIELRSDIAGLVLYSFSEDGNYLAGWTWRGPLRVWNIETRQIIASTAGRVRAATFAAGGRVLVVIIEPGRDHEISFYDLAHPDRAPRRIPGRDAADSLAVSPDGGLVASATQGGLVRLFDPIKAELIDSVHGHLNGAHGVAFSADGRRLISTSTGREAIKLWDVSTRQELLTLGGTFGLLARWSADGDVILAGAPWQAWRAPSWEEIAAAEAKEKTEIKQP